MSTFFTPVYDQLRWDDKAASGSWGWEQASAPKPLPVANKPAAPAKPAAVPPPSAPKPAAAAVTGGTTGAVAKAVAILAMFCLSFLTGKSAFAQNLPPTAVYARDYNYGAIQSAQANTYTFNGPGACQYTPTGGSVNGLANNFFVFSGTQGATTVYFPTAILDATPTLSEIVTPSATTQGATSCGFAATTVNTHTSFQLQSGTAGLQEAIASAPQSAPLFDVVLDKSWYQLIAGLPGPPTAASIIAALTGNTNVDIVDSTTAPWTYYAWNGASYAAVSASGGAGFTSLTKIAAPVALTTVAATCLTNLGGCITVGTTGGTIPSGAVYTLAATYVTANGGETLMSIDTAAGATIAATTTATSTITVTSPAPETGAVGWRLYMTAASGATVTEILYANSCATLSTGQTVLNGVCAIGSSATITKIITGTALGPSLTGTTPAVSSAFPVSSGSSSPILVSYPPFADQGTIATGTTQPIGSINLPTGFLNSLGRTIRLCGTYFATANGTAGTYTLSTNLASVPGVTTTSLFTAITGTLTVSVSSNTEFCETWTTAKTGTAGTIEVHGFATTNLVGTTAVGSVSQDIVHAVSSTADLTKQDQIVFNVTPTTTGTTALQLRQLTLEILQ